MTCRLNRLWPRLDTISNSFALVSITFKAAGSTKLVVAPILEFHVSPLASWRGPWHAQCWFWVPKTGQKRFQKETKTDVPATYGKSGFDMLFVMFQPCRTSRTDHFFVVIRGAKLGCKCRSRETLFQDTLWRLKRWPCGPKHDSWVPSGARFGAKILEKGALECTLAPLGSQGGFKMTPNQPKAFKLIENGIQIVWFFILLKCLSKRCTSQAAVYRAGGTNSKQVWLGDGAKSQCI